MRLLAAVCVYIAISVVGCSKGTGSIIVLDHWWNSDYAKNACGALLPLGFNDPGLVDCQNKQAEALQDFELELSTQLAARPECAGVRVLGFKLTAISPEVAEAVKGEYWSLSLNYSTPDSKKQQWQMLRSPKGAVRQGDGTPREIASDVCSIVRGRGANVRDST